MINENNIGLSITEQCQMLNLARSTRYYRPSDESPENQIIMRRLDELYTNYPTWGSRKMRDALQLEGFRVNRKRIQRLMRLMCLEAIFPKRNLSKRNQAHLVYPYLLRGVAIVRCDQVWSTDITFIRLKHGWVYMTAIIDWYSKAILSWRLSNTIDKYFCIEALEDALMRHGKPDIFNTDQGSQFTSPEFMKVLKDAEIKISMDGKGRALDNLPIERFWRTLKWDEVYLKDYENLSDARNQIGKYIEVYNRCRPHATLLGKTPMSVYASRCGDKEVA
jgi:putative transposase